jgi:transposase
MTDSLNREVRERKEIEDKLVAALETEPNEMAEADWDRMRERVRLAAATTLPD